MQQQINREPTAAGPVSEVNTGPTIGGAVANEPPTLSSMPTTPPEQRSGARAGAWGIAGLVIFILLVFAWWVFSRGRIMMTHQTDNLPVSRPRVGLSTPGAVNAPGTNLNPNGGKPTLK